MNTINNQNIIIAKFMGETKSSGFSLDKNGGEVWEYDLKFSNIEVSYNHVKNHPAIPGPLALRFNKCWNWLMPVIEKIGTIQLPDDKYESGERIYIESIFPRTFGMKNKDSGEYMFRFNGFKCHYSDSLIKCAHAAVVDVLESELIFKTCK